MKLNYRDKVILGFVLAVAIVLAGYFALIKPKNETIKNDTKKLDTLEETEKEYKNQIAQIEPLKTTINEIVAESNKVTENFVDRNKISNPVLLDKFMQHFAEENEIRLKSVAVGGMSESSIPFYFMDAQDIGSSLRSLADINGDYQKEVDAANAEANQLSQKAPNTVLMQQYGIEATCTQKNLWKFMDVIENYDDAIIINSISFEKVDEDEDKSDNKNSEGGENKSSSSKSDDDEYETIEPDDTVEAKIVISLYSVYDLPQVKVEEVQ